MQAAIYDKALRRRDVSGVVAAKADEEPDSKSTAKDKDADKGKAKGDKKKSTDKKAKKEEAKKELKTGADSGKIVNLMAGKYIAHRAATMTLSPQATLTGSQTPLEQLTISTAHPSRSLLPRCSCTSEYDSRNL